MKDAKKSTIRNAIVSGLLERKNAPITWQELADELGIKKGTLWRYCNDPEYTPKAIGIRRKLGITARHRIMADCYTPAIKTAVVEFVAMCREHGVRAILEYMRLYKE